MKYSIVYQSLTGNTKMLADTIKEKLNSNDLIYCGKANEKALEADYIYVGFWTDKGRCDEVTENFLKTIHNKKVFLFGTCGFGASEEYFNTIAKRTATFLSEDNELVGSFICQGKMPMSVRQRYVKMKEAGTPIPNIDMLIDNFDKALTHPDEKDLDNLSKKF